MNKDVNGLSFFLSKKKNLERTGTAAPSFAFNPPPVGCMHCTVTSCSFRELGSGEIYGTGVNPCCQAFLTVSLITCFVWVSKEDPSEVHFSLLLLLDLDLLLQTGLLQNGLGWGKGWILVLGVSDTDALMSSMEVTGLNSPMVQICIALFCLWQERKE